MKNNLSFVLIIAVIFSGLLLAFAPLPAAKTPAPVVAQKHLVGE